MDKRNVENYVEAVENPQNTLGEKRKVALQDKEYSDAYEYRMSKIVWEMGEKEKSWSEANFVWKGYLHMAMIPGQ